MKRARNGKTIHRDDCTNAKSAVHWSWADGMSNEELYVRMLAYPWLRLCQTCFAGTKEELAMKAVEGRARLKVAAAEYFGTKR